MRGRDLTDLLILAAVWGASFLFIRMAVGDFGPFALIELRVGLGALCLLPFVFIAGKLDELRRHWKVLLANGTFAAALPFTFYAYAAQVMGAGYLSVINASAPAWVAVVGWVWFRDRLPRLAVLGLVIGFSGIVVLVWDKLFVNAPSTALAVAPAVALAVASPGGVSELLGTLAAMAAPICYGLAANHAKRYLSGIAPIVNAAGTNSGAALILAPFAIYTWPTQPVSFQAWSATILLAVLCTSMAYILFYRLLASVGPSKTVIVTFLVPVFGVFWGAFLLHEALTTQMLVGAAIILAGSALVIGGGRSGGRSARTNK